MPCNVIGVALWMFHAVEERANAKEGAHAEGHLAGRKAHACLALLSSRHM